MSDAFYPVLSAGAAVPPPRDQDGFTLYALRSFRGVESPAAAPGATTRRGFNAEAEHTARADAALRAEHDANGIHATVKIARAVLFLEYDGLSYELHQESEDRGVVHADASIATLTVTAVGQVKIVLATAMPSTDLVVVDLIDDEEAADDDSVMCLLSSVTDASTFYVERWAGDSSTGGMIKEHGPMAFAVFAG